MQNTSFLDSFRIILWFYWFIAFYRETVRLAWEVLRHETWIMSCCFIVLHVSKDAVPHGTVLYPHETRLCKTPPLMHSFGMKLMLNRYSDSLFSCFSLKRREVLGNYLKCIQCIIKYIWPIFAFRFFSKLKWFKKV